MTPSNNLVKYDAQTFERSGFIEVRGNVLIEAAHSYVQSSVMGATITDDAMNLYASIKVDAIVEEMKDGN